ncbi:MAG: 3-dehydroquinate synthase [Acidobacteriota bacterium]
MRTVRVELGNRAYDILIGPKLLDDIGSTFRERGIGQRIFVITNPVVFDLYGEGVMSSLTAAGFKVVHLQIPDGEPSKSLHTVENIYTYLIAQKADRRSTLVALGGGVTGDIVGFVAATFLRGIPYVQLPTTLLSQVDSSVGGKTGVNHRLGKNMIGAFYQPHLVCIDTKTLDSLPMREFRSGLYEVIKYGLIYDEKFFDFVAGNLAAILNRDGASLERIISRCCEIKAEVIAIDEREENLRRILNFGHTMGHALEAATEYDRFKHGEAVAHGMLAAAHLSRREDLIDEPSLRRICEAVRSVGSLPSAADISFERLSAAIRRDKKREDDQTVFVLLNGIGRTEIRAGFDETLLEEMWARALAEVEA